MADQARRDQESMYCHACHHQWQSESESFQCPACMSASIEIVSPDNDPRHFHDRQPAANATAPPAPAHEPSNSETDRQGGAASGQTNGSTSRSDNDPFARLTLRFTSQPRVTFFTIVNGNPTAPAAEVPTPGTVVGMRFSPIFHVVPTAPPPTGNNTPPAETPEQQQNTQQHGQPTDAPQQPGEEHHHHQQHQHQHEPHAPHEYPMLPAGLFAYFLTSLFNPAAAGHAVLGDAVFSQEALDRIITQLRDQEPITGGAPPASQAALDRLRVQVLDDKLLARMGFDTKGDEERNEGKGESKARCVVCVDDMCRGEEVAVLPCEHFFHGECVVPWLKVHNTCPVCRGSVEVEVEGEKGKAAKEPERPESMDCS